MIATALLFLATSALAKAPEEQPHWSVDCKAGEHSFTVKFDSPTNDVTDDDMKVTIASDSGEAVVPVKPGWYRKRGTISENTHKSACQGMGALDVGNGSLLLFLTRDNRPGFDLLTLALYDPATNRVLDQLDGLDQLKSADPYTSYIAVKTRDGFKTRLVRDSVRGTGSDGAETYIEDWKYLHVRGGKISAAWNK